MKRGVLFARMLQAVGAAPIILAFGRGAPTGEVVEITGSMATLETTAEAELTDGYAFRYIDGATSLIQLGPVTPAVLRAAGAIPRVVVVAEHVWENGRWLLVSEHMPIWGP